MRRIVPYLLLLSLAAAAATATTPEDDAKALFDHWKAAWKARDADAMARLLAPDCVIIMTEPLAGAKRARFFTSESYMTLVRERFAAMSTDSGRQTLHAVSAAETGDVFVIGEATEQARVGSRTEFIRESFYAVTHPIDGKMLFRFIVSQLTTYTPDQPKPK
jgi:uncharacterized protein (TIGR02246 family)